MNFQLYFFYSLKSKIDRQIISMRYGRRDKKSFPPKITFCVCVCVQTINKILNSLCCQPHCIFLLFIINIISLSLFLGVDFRLEAKSRLSASEVEKIKKKVHQSVFLFAYT